MSAFTLTWNISNEEEGILVREYLKSHDISKTALTDIKFSGGKILVNQQEVTVRYMLKEGDRLEVVFPVELPSSSAQGEQIPIDIVYEDEYVLVVNKPAGMNTIPSREHPTGSLANAIVGYYGQINLTATAHIVTRLDRDTSGLVLIAKHRYVHHLLSKQQKLGNVKRFYHAIVEGSNLDHSGRIVAPIGRKEDSIIEREVRTDGQYACTHYRVLRRFKGYSLVELSLETGRTHQIRVHLSYLGHPLLGDDLYGGNRRLIIRQALHCCKLSFYHPLLNKEWSLQAAAPMDMSILVD
ncbi:RluA family pseudouridine synthase [Cytobacillus spongiae]|jgi:23S rRNA pseudouridine1911/1915/1917 synthase|uniref:RluA family pseudouridine synthase n=1 Tax=Cytobacillus spongiae TaxID=2901381 RepID=UPI001F45CD04|nr:RluA family pseudouridine synthase [Cytobacillus spongiae]UII57034.1 RluA family pseudouridine synthase [Cytobacillus spongiae]